MQSNLIFCILIQSSITSPIFRQKHPPSKKMTNLILSSYSGVLTIHLTLYEAAELRGHIQPPSLMMLVPELFLSSKNPAWGGGPKIVLNPKNAGVHIQKMVWYYKPISPNNFNAKIFVSVKTVGGHSEARKEREEM